MKNNLLKRAAGSLYGTLAEREGMFYTRNLSNSPQWDSLYVIHPDSGTLELMQNEDRIPAAIASPVQYLAPVCDYPSNPVQGKQNGITMLRPGRIQLQGDYWKVSQKISIDFTPAVGPPQRSNQPPCSLCGKPASRQPQSVYLCSDCQQRLDKRSSKTAAPNLEYVVHVVAEVLGEWGRSQTSRARTTRNFQHLLAEHGLEKYVDKIFSLGDDDISFPVENEEAARLAVDTLNRILPSSPEWAREEYGTGNPAEAIAYQQPSPQDPNRHYLEPTAWTYAGEEKEEQRSQGEIVDDLMEGKAASVTPEGELQLRIPGTTVNHVDHAIKWNKVPAQVFQYGRNGIVRFQAEAYNQVREILKKLDIPFEDHNTQAQESYKGHNALLSRKR